MKSEYGGKAWPVVAEGIDGIACATVSTNATLSADAETTAQLLTDQTIFGTLATDNIVEEAVIDTSVVEAVAQDNTVSDASSYTASAHSFAGPVAVTLTLDGNTITAIEIVADSFA